MAESLQTARFAKLGRLALPHPRDVLDLINGTGTSRAIDASYGDSLPQLLPRRLVDLFRRGWRRS
jgi:hypothetical protein